MATNGSIRINTAFGYVQLYWQTQSQDIVNNRSVVGYELSIYRSYNISSTASKQYSINMNGVVVASGSTTIGGSGNKIIFAGTTTIPHNSDGTKSFAYSFSQQIDITYSGNWIGTITGSGTGTLNTIARATQPTLNISAQDMNAAIVINTPRASSQFTHTLRYGFGQLRETIATNVATSFSWTIPLNLANQIGHATSGVGLIWCDTYNGSTLIGTKEVAFTAKVPANIVPYFTSVSITEAVSGLASQFGAYVQHKSKINVVANANGVYSSQIVSYKHEILGAQYLSKDFTSGLLSQSGTVVLKSTVTDTRGRTATVTHNLNVLPYAPPKINSFKGVRCLSNGTENYDGTYLKSSFNFAISPLNNKNTKQYIIRYKLKTSTTWINLLNSSDVYSANSSHISTSAILLDTNSYDVSLYIADYFSSDESIVDIGTVFTLLDFRNTGKGMAVGKVSEKDAFEVGMEMEVQGCPIRGGAITIYHNVQQALTTNAYTKLNFAKVMSVVGNNLSLNNNSVVCLKKGFVEVSGMVSLTGGIVSGDNIYAFMFKDSNGAGTSLTISQKTMGTDWTTLQINPVVINVNAGDSIYISVLNNNARGTFGNADNLAWMNKLTVKYVG